MGMWMTNQVHFPVNEKGLTPEQAYVVSSVAVDLRIGQLVDVPNYIEGRQLQPNLSDCRGCCGYKEDAVPL